MSSAQRFCINSDRVVHETIDGETIVIHLQSGTYYSLAGSGAEIWGMLAGGRSVDEVVDELSRCYDSSPAELMTATENLVDELREEGLLEEGLDSVAAVEPNGAPTTAVATRGPFAPPELKKYTDMQYFLLLDPIHEVAGLGWPNPAEQAND